MTDKIDTAAIIAACASAEKHWPNLQTALAGNPIAIDAAADFTRIGPSTISRLATEHQEMVASLAEAKADAELCAGQWAAELRHSNALRDRCVKLTDAVQTILEVCQHGDFRNGNTDSTGSVDEGEVRAWEIIEGALDSLSVERSDTAPAEGLTRDAPNSSSEGDQ